MISGFGRDEGPTDYGRVSGVSGLDVFGGGNKFVAEFLVAGFVTEDVLKGDADLPSIGKCAGDQFFDCIVEISIGANDGGGVSAEFEADALSGEEFFEHPANFG